MPLYRKKLIVIKAQQILDSDFDLPHPNDRHMAGVIYDPLERCVIIPTLEGPMRGNVGDFIITGIKGELYPYKPDIFAATYDDVPEPGGE